MFKRLPESFLQSTSNTMTELIAYFVSEEQTNVKDEGEMTFISFKVRQIRVPSGCKSADSSSRPAPETGDSIATVFKLQSSK